MPSCSTRQSGCSDCSDHTATHKPSAATTNPDESAPLAEGQVVLSIPGKPNSEPCPGAGIGIGPDPEQLASGQQLTQRLQIVAGIGPQLHPVVDPPGTRQHPGEYRQGAATSGWPTLRSTYWLPSSPCQNSSCSLRSRSARFPSSIAAKFIGSNDAVARRHDPVAQHSTTETWAN